MKFFLPAFILIASLFQPARVEAVEFTKGQSGQIAAVVGKIMEQGHYRQVKFDNAISTIFLTNYLNALDYNHLFFLQSDIDEFTDKYSTSLDDLTLESDALPAFKIFGRYLDRLGERHRMVEKILAEPLDFSKDESFIPARNKVPWPKNEAEAEELWRARVKFELLQGRLNKEKPEETLKVVTRRYARLEKTMREFENEEILQLYLSSLTRAFDPHSDYMSPTEASNFDINNITLSLSGIGAQLEWDDGYTKIKMLVPGGPAELSKQLKPGDRIIAVGQAAGEPVDTIEMRLNKVVSMIRGKRGTEVRLTIIPASSPDGSVKKIVTLVRDEIKLKEQFAKAQVIEQVDSAGATHRLGVINLPQFYEHCAAHVEKLITRLKKEHVEGLVLDLRHNGGGILDEAISLTGLFIKKGPVVQVRGHNKQIQVLRDDDSKVAYDGPLTVLVDRLSASASEITAAALQDYGRAVVVGDQSTHGKGTVQTVLSLESFISPQAVPKPGKLKLTVSKFYRIAGGTTQKEGVVPDVILPSVYDYVETGESSLPNCLPADHIPAVDYTSYDRVKTFLPVLQRNSKARIAQSKDFAYLREDIEEVKKHQEDKSVSLNEAKRLQEKKEAKERMEARKKERAARTAPADKTYDLTLDNVEKNEPLVLAKLTKQKDEELAALTTTDENAESAVEIEPPVDAPLHETLAILTDYESLLPQLDKASGEKVVLKARSSREPQ